MTLKDKIMIFINAKINQLESERNALRHSSSLRPLDGFYMYEMMRSEIRIEAWEEYVHELFNYIMYSK